MWNIAFYGLFLELTTIWHITFYIMYLFDPTKKYTP